MYFLCFYYLYHYYNATVQQLYTYRRPTRKLYSYDKGNNIPNKEQGLLKICWCICQWRIYKIAFRRGVQNIFGKSGFAPCSAWRNHARVC